MKDKNHIVIGVGEILWDMLPKGKTLGGAPANFAYHANQLGIKAFIISAIGNDKLGEEILEYLHFLGLNSSCIRMDQNYPTGSVDVKIGPNGIPSYIIHENTAWDNIYLNNTYLNEECFELVQKADAVCFGSLCQRTEVSRRTVLNILGNTKSQCIKVFDVNLRQNYYNRDIIVDSLKLTNVLKLNEDELPIIVNLLELEKPGSDPSVKDVLYMLAEKYSLKLIALTRGDKGSYLLYDGKIFIHPGYKIKVLDTVGAGDAFTAAVVVGLLKGMDIEVINDFANRVGAYVCTQEGGMCPYKDNKLSSFIKYYKSGVTEEI